MINPSGQLSSDESVEPRVTRAAKEWLATQDNTQWLLIIDNYDDIDAVNVYNILPTCDTGHVIITSRRSTLHKLGRTVPVDEIDENAGIRILLKNANKPEINDGGKYDGKPRLRNELTQLVHYDVARQVTIKLGFLPLALAQAGSYIAQSQITFQKYMTLLRENFKTVATRGVQSAEERKNRTIFTTWEISFASLSPSAQELLLLCGFLANEDIPDEIFIKGGKLFDWMEDGEQPCTWYMIVLIIVRKRLARRFIGATFFAITGNTQGVRRFVLDTSCCPCLGL